ncbi:MAG: RNA polymerase sigma factor [Prevotellaceae bacterium]|nr:RNA polymerase sigma factor [Candidatus Colivivens caballi]
MTAQEFKQQFLPHHRVLYRVAYHLTGNALDAEDLLQDLYLKLWTKRNELPPEAQQQAYLVTMIRHLYYDQCRQKHIDVSAELIDEHDPPDGHDVAQQIEDSDAASQMTQLIDQLPEKEQKVVRLRIVDDRSYKEIEDDTGLTQTNIRTTISRARKKLIDQFLKRTHKT